MSDEARQVWDATVADLKAMGIASPADRWALLASWSSLRCMLG
jgi:hypothetical protein